MISKKASVNFELGSIFNGLWTITNKVTGEHRTFRVRSEEWQDKKSGGTKVVRTVALLIGPKNTSDYKPFATVSRDGDRIWVYKNLRGEAKKSQHDYFALMLSDLFKDGQYWGSRYDLTGNSFCCICNRALTNPQSQENGIGPKCSERI